MQTILITLAYKKSLEIHKINSKLSKLGSLGWMTSDGSVSLVQAEKYRNVKYIPMIIKVIAKTWL